MASQPADDLYVSDIAFAEIRFGVEQMDDANRRADFNLWLDRTMRPLFEGRVLPITEDVILRWKMLQVEGQKRGHTFGQPDLFIAAIAILEGLVVVSRDTSEFIEAGVPVFDPWTHTLYARGASFVIAAPVTLEGLTNALKRESRR